MRVPTSEGCKDKAPEGLSSVPRTQSTVSVGYFHYWVEQKGSSAVGPSGLVPAFLRLGSALQGGASLQFHFSKGLSMLSTLPFASWSISSPR